MEKEKIEYLAYTLVAIITIAIVASKVYLAKRDKL